MNATASTRSYAVTCAARGWPVFPLWPIRGDGGCGCGDPACGTPGKHPVTRGWPNAIASVTAAEHAWDDRFGERGIGIALGSRVGMWVLDVDPRHGGDLALEELERDHGPLPTSLRVQTGGDGLHIYFAWPDDGTPVTNSNGLPVGLDTRGQGGFVVLPPSSHASGERYRWLVSPWDGALEPAPGWLLELVRQRKRSLAALINGNEEAGLIRPGHRREALVRFCGHLRSMGLYENTIVECGHAFLRHQCEQLESIDWGHAEKTMRDVARRYPPYPTNRGV